MEFSSQIRKQIKAEQKANVMANLGRCFGITALSILPVILIALLGAGMMIGTMASLSPYDLYDPYATNQLSNSMANVYAIILLLEIVVAGPLTLGLMNFYIAVMRGEKPGVGMLFQPFTSIRTIWRAIRMVCCYFFRALLWILIPYAIFLVLSIVILVPAMVAMFLPATTTAFYGVPQAGFFIAFFVLLVLYIIGVVFAAIRAAAYLPGYVLMHDDEQIGAWQATKQANAAFKGHYKDLFAFYLSFTPWYLLFYGVIILVGVLFAVAMTVLAVESNIAAFVGLYIAMYILIIVLSIFFGGFVGAYQNTAFFAMFTYLTPREPQPALQAQGGISLEKPDTPDAPGDSTPPRDE